MSDVASLPPLRVAVVGARRRTQGIGEHLARFLAEAGCAIVGVLGTAAATAAEAARTLEASTGQRARAYTNTEDLLQSERPDVLVIASPHATHVRYLELAVSAGLHVLCEKPLVWHAGDPVADAERLARAFHAAGLHLHVNTQWPQTLPAYDTLFPGVRAEPPSRFYMRLSPRSRGVAMLPDALPHALSLLGAVRTADDAAVSDVEVRFEDAERERARVRFVYEAAGHRIDVTIDLVRQLEQPRVAQYGFDGRLAARRVEMPPYRFFLESDDRQVPLPDPTPLLVRSFLDALAAGPPEAIVPAAIPGVRLLAEIVGAAPPERAP